MDDELATELTLEAAESLFYQRGIQAVGMDEVRTKSGVSLKRLYRLFASKTDLVEAYLRRRDERWRIRLADYVAREPDPRMRPLAVFDWLGEWFAEPDFRGCAFINSYGELGSTVPSVASASREHKIMFQQYFAGLVRDGGYPESVTPQLVLLAEGAMVVAGMKAGRAPAEDARTAAAALLSL